MMLLRRVAQRVEDAARLHASEPLLRVERHDPVEMAGEVDHDGYVAALPGEARAAASRDDWGIMLAAVPDGLNHLVAAPWCHDADRHLAVVGGFRSEEHTSELQSLMRISYAVFCLKKKK